MKIAQIAPLYESVPPKYYGGTERVIHYLTEELVRKGHDVTLYASGDSMTSARLVPLCPDALRLNRRFYMDDLAHHVLLIEKLHKDAAEYDLLHSHMDFFAYSLLRRATVPSITTLHGRLDLPDLVPLYLEFSDMPVVSISKKQREPLPWLNWQRTIHHGIPEHLYKPRDKPGSYLAFLGRISPEKGIEQAIAIATRAGIPLKIAAKVDRKDQEYYDGVVKPLLDHPLIEYLGEIGEAEKNEFLANALALLIPLDWPEPFGLVMIEAMACGTPVITRARGAVPEIIEDGITGFIFEGAADAIAAIVKAEDLDRRYCRRVFEKHFTAARMADDYIELYKSLVQTGAEDMPGTADNIRPL
jgi:glycosyltransferase involved in cell wall biosynthesis